MSSDKLSICFMLPGGMLLVKTAKERQSTQVADIESWAYKKNWGQALVDKTKTERLGEYCTCIRWSETPMGCSCCSVSAGRVSKQLLAHRFNPKFSIVVFNFFFSFTSSSPVGSSAIAAIAYNCITSATGLKNSFAEPVSEWLNWSMQSLMHLCFSVLSKCSFLIVFDCSNLLGGVFHIHGPVCPARLFF